MEWSGRAATAQHNYRIREGRSGGDRTILQPTPRAIGAASANVGPVAVKREAEEDWGR
jgi:hypothetical protein